MAFSYKIDRMKIISWNIRGAKRSQAISELIYLRKKINPDILFVIETMVSPSTSNRLSKTLGYENVKFVDPIGHCGGMWICWNQSHIDVQIVSLQHRIAHLFVTDKKTNACFSLFGLYAPAQEGEKLEFWNNFSSLIRNNCSFPWCIIGDFNELLCMADKRGGTFPTLNRCLKLQRFAHLHYAIGIPPRGTTFSWKKQTNNHFVYE